MTKEIESMKELAKRKAEKKIPPSRDKEVLYRCVRIPVHVRLERKGWDKGVTMLCKDCGFQFEMRPE